MATTEKSANPDLDFKSQWLELYALRGEKEARIARDRMTNMVHPALAYGGGLLELAEAHEEAAAVYRRRIEELS